MHTSEPVDANLPLSREPAAQVLNPSEPAAQVFNLPDPVAQVFNLPYRRFSTCEASLRATLAGVEAQDPPD